MLPSRVVDGRCAGWAAPEWQGSESAPNCNKMGECLSLLDVSVVAFWSASHGALHAPAGAPRRLVRLVGIHCGGRSLSLELSRLGASHFFYLILPCAVILMTSLKRSLDESVNDGDRPSPQDAKPTSPAVSAGGSASAASSFRNVSACNRCRLRKNRCDQRLPSCATCDKASVKCVGYDPITKREIPRRWVALATCLQACLNNNGQLCFLPRNPRRAPGIAAPDERHRLCARRRVQPERAARQWLAVDQGRRWRWRPQAAARWHGEGAQCRHRRGERQV